MNQVAAPLLTPEQNSLALWALLVLVLPLIAGGLVLIFGKKLPRQGDWLAIATTGLAFFLALYLFFQVWENKTVHVSWSWFQLATGKTSIISFTAGVYLDNLAVLMLVIVTFISLLVQVFSVIYMHGEWRYHHYFGYLGIFTFSMLGIVLSDNLLLLFIFWELVGFSSYLLIGFWYEKDAAVLAGKKAFLFNRVGDIGFLFGIFLLYTYLQTFDLTLLKNAIATGVNQGGTFIFPVLTGQADSVTLSYTLLTLAGLGIFCGCVGKSAQFPLQVWLPDAMEGPTPVSSLIHAATMVAAGVYLLSRCFPFFTEDALLVIAIIGALTALLGALAATAQYDIKKILAFSTISQLGYMVMGMGVGAHDASLLHLVTHAFFKASLFLNAGIVIHAMHHAAHEFSDEHSDVQDIRNMGGFRKILPFTFYAYIPAAAALVGLPLFSGFLSKDAILTGAWAWAGLMSQNGNLLYYLIPVFGFGSVLLTGFYMAKHCFYIFFGESKLYKEPELLRENKTAEASGLLLVPVAILAVLSLAFFFSLNPFSYAGSWVMQGVSWQKLLTGQPGLSGGLLPAITTYLHDASYISLVTAILSVLLAVVGIWLGWLSYKKAVTAGSLSTITAPTSGFSRLAYYHFYLDAFYEKVIINPFMRLSGGAAAFDKNFIDYSLNTFAKIMVVLAKLIGWVDRWLVDGTVHLLVKVAGLIGRLGRFMQNGKVQSYYIFSLLGLILLFLYILAF
ncbi:NADH-quinone oxidoreductase subunit 5 family protein [Adhaeribacter rhizoryzae]|uniref:NADH-quinone oxidoreductase subunit 5 family protein n=1 Tax=Adhaeribacter rhizoryzae TaxID=2607907 RepID=UPI001CC21F18|nr:NADH-quinone oxidoreductase subunit L [Adhaeribacter rhizoryzae]